MRREALVRALAPVPALPLLSLACTLAAGLAGPLAGCSFQSPDSGGTAYSCPPPDLSCPAGFTCVGGQCVRPGGDDDDDQPDAGGGDQPDAPPGSPIPDGGATPDAAPGEPDGPPAPPSITLVFGESNAADQTGVTTDTSLDSTNPQNELGGDRELHIDADPDEVALLRFDLSAIPDTAVVESAELTISVSDPIESGDYRAQALALSWSEANANYIQRSSSSNWPVQGAGGASIIDGDIAIFDAPTIDVYTVQVDTAAVQAWVSDPAHNFGMRWIAASPDGRGGRFFSSEANNAADRPVLSVTFH
jgi:hypothetical protein